MSTSDRIAARVVGVLGGIVLYMSIAIVGAVISGCTSTPQDGSIQAIRQNVAVDQYRECRRYYLFRANKLLHPDPEQICSILYDEVRKGKTVINWRM